MKGKTNVEQKKKEEEEEEETSGKRGKRHKKMVKLDGRKGTRERVLVNKFSFSPR